MREFYLIHDGITHHGTVEEITAALVAVGIQAAKNKWEIVS